MGRFSNKDQRLRKQIKFPPEFDQKVDMKKVELSVFKPWIYQRVTEIIGLEDEVVIEYVNEQLEQSGKSPDPKDIQIKLTGFLGSKTGEFMLQLWKLLLSAQVSTGGVPAEFIEAKKQELRAKNEADKRVLDEAARRQQHSERLDEIRDRERRERNGGGGGGGGVSVEEGGGEEGVVGVVMIAKETLDGEAEVVGREETTVPLAEAVDEGVTRAPLHLPDIVLVLHPAVDVDPLRILAQGLLAHHHPGAITALQEVHHAGDPGAPGPGHRCRGLPVGVQDAGALAEAGAEAHPGEMPEEARRHRDDAAHQEGEDDPPLERLHARVLVRGLLDQLVEGRLPHHAAETRGRRRHLLVVGLAPVRHHHPAGATRDHPLRNKGGVLHHASDLALHQLLAGAWDRRLLLPLEAVTAA
ncbi:hypothetical protein FRC01_001148 [Tulasnella sp. 417]|nr:hypothetical protein FRC01_001148 [Tulasnella sp. 417]